MAEGETILTKMQDLLLYMLPQIGKFPRDQKYLLGDRIIVKLLEVQENLLRAYYGKQKLNFLYEANLTLEIIRHLVRLSFASKLFGTDRYEVMSRKLDELGRMVGAWIKQQNLPRGNTGK